MRYLILFLVSVMFACSDFDEEYQDKHNLHNLSVSSIETELPVFNIAVDPTDYDSMMKNYAKEVELPCRVFMYREGNLLLDNISAEIEIKGGRTAAFELKSLGVKFDNSLSNEERNIINPTSIMDRHELDKIKALRFRNSGNDHNVSFLKDVIYTQLAINANLDLDVMYYEPCHMFVNDQYYGMLNMRTESNAHGISRLYGVKKRNTTMAKMVPPGIIEFKNGDEERITELESAVKSADVSKLNSLIDIDNFIDYVAYETLLGHGDWPQNNVRFYAIEEGKFRFVLYDLDLVSMFDLNRKPIDYILNAEDCFIKDLFVALYQDNTFKSAYDERFAEIIASGDLKPEKLAIITDDIVSKIERDIPIYIQQAYSPNSIVEWLRNIEEINAQYQRRYNFVKSL